MLNEKDKKTIDQYVNSDLYDTDRLLKYLNMHTMVGNEIFSYCDRRNSERNSDRPTYAIQLDDDCGYTAVDVATFIKRVPFYFYAMNLEAKRFGHLGCVLPRPYDIDGTGEVTEEDVEKTYLALEYMFYEKHIELENIFCYPSEQTSGSGTRKLFVQWNHYLHLCDEQGIDDPMPECFIAKYNERLEAARIEPIIYEISESGIGEAYWRFGMELQFEGTFPFDDNGRPIMKWIGIRTKDAGPIVCDTEKSSPHGRLRIALMPKTVIEVLNFYNDKDEKEDYWYQVYAGPLNMEFDFDMLKHNRKRLKMTQQQVADAVGANLRTYQKWENGETTPDGHYLLRLMNWLDVDDVQNAIKYMRNEEGWQ